MAEYKILVQPPHPVRRAAIVVIVVVAVIAVGVGAYTLGRHGDGGKHAGAKGSPVSGGQPVAAPKPLAVVSSVPGTGAVNVPSNQVVTVQFSEPLMAGNTLPSFVPPVSGSWTKEGSYSLSFNPTAPFIPTTTESLVIPAGNAGPHSRTGRTLAQPVSLTFTVAQASTERLQQLLAQLDYLPLTFTPSAPLSSANQAVTAQPGSFAWRWPSLPASLTSLWTEGSENVITKAAVMNFENQNGLGVDGLAGKEVWTALLGDLASGKVDANSYNYVFVSKQLPENLTVYVNGAPQLANTPVNTGAPGADTADGTYPVFEHVTSSRMVGTNPDGSHYDDPNVPWASYFNGGDALHGFVRASYGFPQSNGCVEMAVANAAQVWPLTPIGTLVTVVGPAS